MNPNTIPADAEPVCAKDPNAAYWFPEDFSYGAQDVAAAYAKKGCGRCLHRLTCLSLSLTSDERFGIWGGLDADERAALVGAV